MATVGSPLFRFSSNTFLTIASVTLTVLTLVAVALQATQRISLSLAISLILLPIVASAVALRPSWVILGLLAIPPAFLRTTYRPLILLLLLTLAAQLLLRGRVFLERASALFPFFLLVVAAFAFEANVDPDATFVAETFQKQLIYYALLGLASYNATRLGDLKFRNVVIALLVGIWITVLLKVAVSGFGPVPYGVGSDRSNIESLFFGRDFGFFAIMAFAIYFSHWLSRGRGSPLHLSRGWTAAAALFFLLISILSLVRAVWLAAVLVILIASAQGRKRSYWLLVLPVVALVLLVPIARERIAPGALGSNPDITSGRWSLWTEVWAGDVAPALPWGNGFGHAWTITPEELFGFSTFRFEGVDTYEYVYTHNDFLFWMVEFGLFGLGLMIAFWTGVVALIKRLNSMGADTRLAAMMLLGVIVVMFMSHLFGNAFFFRAVAERFFVAVGFLGALRAIVREQSTVAQAAGQLRDA